MEKDPRTLEGQYSPIVSADSQSIYNQMNNISEPGLLDEISLTIFGVRFRCPSCLFCDETVRVVREHIVEAHQVVGQVNDLLEPVRQTMRVRLDKDSIANNAQKPDTQQMIKDGDSIIHSAKTYVEHISDLTVGGNPPTKLNFKNIPDHYSLAHSYPDKESENMETEEINVDEHNMETINQEPKLQCNDIANTLSVSPVSEKKNTECFMNKENVSPEFKKISNLPQYIQTDSCQILHAESPYSSSVSSKLVMDLDFNTENTENMTDNVTAVEVRKELDSECLEEYDSILQLEMSRNELQSEISQYQIEPDIHQGHGNIINEDPNWTGSLFDRMSTGSCSTSSDHSPETKVEKHGIQETKQKL